MHTLQKSGYLCHEQQMYTLRRVTISEGKAKNTGVIEVQTAGGLQLDILPDAGLDIGQVRYKGTNVTFISKNGYDTKTDIISARTAICVAFSLSVRTTKANADRIVQILETIPMKAAR